ncbi:MAG: type II CAAX endopeptidase family protein [Burkholderiales bacterium]|nr:type II CAAX endopeptidase family protein [Burkholderiales bacterium]
MITPAARYLALADEGRSASWRYLLGIALLVPIWIVGGVYAYTVAMQLPLGAVTEFVAINASVLMLLAGVVAVTALLHRRSWRTLVTPSPRVDWYRILQGAAAWVVLAALFCLVESLLYPGRYAWSFELWRWLPFVAAALLLTPLQCAAEELVFRGYLMQAAGRVCRHPVVPALFSSAVFTLPHLYNPEVAAYGLGIMAANYFAMGLFLAVVTLRDGRLELAIGAHAGNNLLLVLFVHYEDSVFETPSVFTAGALDPVYSLVTLLLGAILFYVWFFGKLRARE